jgi:hypothetical protein
MSLLINPYSLTRVNLVQNGDFKNVSGMPQSGPWYGGVPPLWTSIAAGSTSGFTVLNNGGVFYANLQTLSETNSPTAPNFRPLYQVIAPIPYTRIFVATWSVVSLTGSNYFNGAAIYPNSLSDTPLVLYSSPFDNQSRTVSMSASVPANTLTLLAFWQAAGTAPGITNVTLYAD